MGLRFRKSIKLGGGTRLNLSKSGIGFSVGTKGLRYTKKAGGGTRKTISVPGTGISYVKESGNKSKKTRSAGSVSGEDKELNQTNSSKKSSIWLWVLGWICVFPLPLTIILLRKKNIKASIKYGLIIASWLIYFIIVAAYKSGSKDKNQTSYSSVEQSTREVVVDTSSEERKVRVNDPVQVESISTEVLDSNLVLNGTTQATATIKPENADSKVVTWTSSDESVVTINDAGLISAMGGGKATITASADNGVSSSFEIEVDGSKRIMNSRVTFPRDDKNNIGDEWSYVAEINGESVERKITVEAGETLQLFVRITESDDNPDIGEASKSYTVTEDDLKNGFVVTLDVYVKENGGRNRGKQAHFIVTYTFSK